MLKILFIQFSKLIYFTYHSEVRKVLLKEYVKFGDKVLPYLNENRIENSQGLLLCYYLLFKDTYTEVTHLCCIL